MDHSTLLTDERFDVVGRLPPEIGQMVLSHLSPRELTRCSGVSKRWRALTNCISLWKRHCYKKEWTDLKMVDNFKSHYLPKLKQSDASEAIEEKCSWRVNYERHQALPVNWERNRSVRYRLSDPRDSPVSCIHCDGERLAMARADGHVTVLNIETLPSLEADLKGLLDSRILQVKIKGDLCVIQQNMLLQFFSLQDGFLDAKSFDSCFATVELFQCTGWKPHQVNKMYKPGKIRDVFFDILNDRVYVGVRDLQCIFVWDKHGKRADTIHIPNRMCKLRDMLLYKDCIHVIYASRDIRHVTAYDLTLRKWIYEVTTPLCKTQKLIGADSLLAGVAVASPGFAYIGVITVWDRTNGKIISERHTPGYLSFKSVAAVYELIIYGETTSISIWEPRSNTILRRVSTEGNPVYLQRLPFTLLAVFTDRYAYVWDWFTGAKCFRIFTRYVPDNGEFLWTDQTTLIIKTDEHLVDMIGFC
ncbi:uncharacterized protein LOC106662384 [Cimex lectularius]|uniref:F-box domain-containing protein n=1 Tax=Cimex lectularius TaxID=79782 RepID=A0A8I6REX9_CIMLE|nr:uncharacterized protein LOC106662384 [Cimex lectularius]